MVGRRRGKEIRNTEKQLTKKRSVRLVETVLRNKSEHVKEVRALL